MKTQNHSHLMQDMAQNYIQGRLSPEEQVSFEEYLMEHPDLLENLQLDNLFSKTLPEVDIQSKKPTDAPVPQWRFSWLSNLSLLGVGAMAAYASVFILSLFDSRDSSLQTLDSVVYVETMRSRNTEDVSAKLPLSAGTIGLMIAADFEQSGPFDVTISEYSTQRLIVQIKGVNKTENEDIAVILDTQLFTEGLYLIETTDYQSGKQNSLIVEFDSPPKKN